MGQIVAVAVITVLAVISPGADFAMITRNSYLYGRGAGVFAALGISLGVLVHVTYTILGVGLVLTRTPVLFTVVKVVGACYLIWIGHKTFSARAQSGSGPDGTAAGLSRLQSLRTGFLTNALNPKTMLFVLSTFSQVVHHDTPLAQQIGYGLFMSLAHLIWFTLAACLFSVPALRTRMLDRQRGLNRTIGSVLVALGLSLIFVSA
ncbi:LysE family translocator [Streptomyces sp. VRA16 Mangrove soil]|uniref:LysE family translocator n=1 Tax=Streptomyces sp. VRA16 Mangrove soil TaxID=2817434 RepID=UPI001A9E997B|nr:LysE family transporter [Streptomyces sp. VRA16 Mangrove soil]MBO1335467.1 LysE family transporter [Streptomyces sp. VRA16 Mangrove soil]